MSILSQLPTRLTLVICAGILLSALVPSNGQLEIVVSILTLSLIFMLLRENFSKELRSWMVLALCTYAIGILADLLDEIPELNSHWLIDSIDDIFIHIGVFLICFCIIKMLRLQRETNSKLRHQIKLTHQLEAQLSQLALKDDLTGLKNRRALFKRFDSMAIHLKRGVLAYINLDNFKHVNDNFSHQCGDDLLISVAKKLVETAPIGSQIYRIGGDEFVVLLPSEDNESSQAWITALYDATEEAMHHYNIDISIGLSPYYPGNLSDPDTILAKANIAMRKKKLSKRLSFDI
ncbi:GGDEF domain-containing protein [Photobacterium nomapromontoriensis]